MQSIEALKQLAVFDRDRIEHVVNKHNLLRLDGNFEGMKDSYAEHASLELLGHPRHFPYAGHYEGRPAVIDAFKRIGAEIEFLAAEISDLLIDRDRAMMRTKVRVRHWGTGLALSHEIWDLFRFEDGLIVHQAKFIDLKSFDSLRSGRA